MPLCCLFTQLLFWTNPASIVNPPYKILTVDPGVYRVSFDQLHATQPLPGQLPSSALGLSFLGEAQPIWVADGGDGIFNEGDHFEFRALPLRGDLSYYHEYTQTSAYFLTLDGSNRIRMTSLNQSEPSTTRLPSAGRGPFYFGQQHLETDTLLMRFRAINHQPHEIWYWHKLSCTDQDPFQVSIDTPDMDPYLGGFVELTLGFRGWSQVSRKLKVPDHVIRVMLNGEFLQEIVWEGKEIHDAVLSPIPALKWKPGKNDLQLLVPARHTAEGELIVDVVLLNWVKTTYPKTPVLLPNQNPVFQISEAFSQKPLQLMAPANEPLLLFSDAGTRLHLHPPGEPNGPVAVYNLPAEMTTASFYALYPKALQKPVAIMAFQPPDLISSSEQVDYLMIAHPRLMDAVQPLADFHRQRGLSVKMVDIRDIYDSFNHGILHPKAIRDFLKHTATAWPKPSPRFVLLVGDASWDTKNATVMDENYPDLTYYPRFKTEFNKILSTPYDDSAQNNRNLIPTLMFFDGTGHSASDNSLVALDDRDSTPHMAIGRLPVTQPEEVTAIVEKTIAYMEKSSVGPWRRHVLYITNEDELFQSQTTQIATDLANSGMVSKRIYPDSRETSNEKHTQVILDALNQGQYMVYFLGHGGRYIWRTGPPDFRKNHDLFTLDDLEKLENNANLPIIVSLTCYSAPFDHPGADSIGEKFLRLKDKGAIAFYGASWRNWPDKKMAHTTMTAMTQAATVGEAIRQSKQEINSETLIQTYNLLGDPAVPLRKPPSPLTLALTQREGQQFVSTTLPEILTTGEGLLELLNEAGDPLATTSFAVTGRTLELTLPTIADGATRLQLYVWNTTQNRDALGLLSLEPTPNPSKASMP